MSLFFFFRKLFHSSFSPPSAAASFFSKNFSISFGSLTIAQMDAKCKLSNIVSTIALNERSKNYMSFSNMYMHFHKLLNEPKNIDVTCRMSSPSIDALV